MKKNKILAMIGLLVSIAFTAQATVTFTVRNRVGPYADGGQTMKIYGILDLQGTYAAGTGISFTGDPFGLTRIENAQFGTEDGITVFYDSTSLVYLFSGSSELGAYDARQGEPNIDHTGHSLDSQNSVDVVNVNELPFVLLGR